MKERLKNNHDECEWVRTGVSEVSVCVANCHLIPVEQHLCVFFFSFYVYFTLLCLFSFPCDCFDACSSELLAWGGHTLSLLLLLWIHFNLVHFSSLTHPLSLPLLAPHIPDGLPLTPTPPALLIYTLLVISCHSLQVTTLDHLHHSAMHSFTFIKHIYYTLSWLSPSIPFTGHPPLRWLITSAGILHLWLVIHIQGYIRVWRPSFHQA